MTQTLSDRLTAEELRVALAVAHGSTNKAVARELGVSVKTIEFHLASVYRKAGVASRGELAHLLRSLAVEPPTGTVSFLCVELSAADVDGLFPVRRAVGLLAECRARFARFVADAGGYACHLGADGLGAAFQSPVQAAAAAVECQCDAASLGVRPRLAIHTGVATLLGSAYVGAPVHRVAQLAAMANSGQVLVSSAAAGLLLDEEWTLVDMGWQRVDADGAGGTRRPAARPGDGRHRPAGPPARRRRRDVADRSRSAGRSFGGHRARRRGDRRAPPRHRHRDGRRGQDDVGRRRRP